MSIQHPQAWVGVDFDGTLARYDGWKSATHLGDPIPEMVERVRRWLAAGRQVKVFTARAHENPETIPLITAWCERHIGQPLPVTASKDKLMCELWDDRAVAVERNTGRVLGGDSWVEKS